MLTPPLALIAFMSYTEWFISTYELQSVYPFDSEQIAPSDAGEPRLREQSFETTDGESLILWVAQSEDAKPTILYLPGNAGNLSARASRFTHFLDQGYGVVALAYRGSSGSTGKPNEALITSDALQVFDTIAELTGSPNPPVILYGESLGTAVAVRIAVQREAAGMVLEAPFTSIPDLAKIQYPSIDLSGVLTQIWDTAAIVGEVEEPLLVLHGTKDQLVPFTHGQMIFELAGSDVKHLEALPDIGHQGVWTEGALNALSEFLMQN